MAWTQYRRLFEALAVAAVLCLCGSGCGGGEKKPAILSHVTITTSPEAEAALA